MPRCYLGEREAIGMMTIVYKFLTATDDKLVIVHDVFSTLCVFAIRLWNCVVTILIFIYYIINYTIYNFVNIIIKL